MGNVLEILRQLGEGVLLRTLTTLAQKTNLLLFRALAKERIYDEYRLRKT
jgi:hypothetical protein